MSNKSRQEKIAKAASRKTAALFAAGFVAVAAASFAGGWFAKQEASAAPVSKALRLSNNQYQYIDPLLLCNINNPSPAQEDKDLSAQLQAAIAKHVKAGDVSKASVYFGDVTSAKWADVNADQKYYPSSLGKIPIMMAYYQYAESHPGALDQKIVYPAGSEDRNAQQDIAPAQAIVPGNTYTARQLIEYMIKYSDNNAANLLYTHIDQDLLNSVYADLNIPTDENPNLANLDFITPHQIATMFRVLYNATYLTREDSEGALELLTQSSFTEGIVAGVGGSAPVAHKLGLVGIAPGDVTTEHELHDCGIVYGKDTYHLCIMTRGAGSLAQLEATVAELSKIVYDKVNK
jgi:beta-lactamase class A